MKDQTKKYLLCGGVLLALGVVSAGLLAGINLVTAPIIAQEAVKKAQEGYKKVFSDSYFSDQMTFATEEEQTALSEAGLKPSTVDYYVTAYKDEAKTEEKGKVFHGSTAGRDATLELLVGFATDESGSPALVKISMLKCSDSFKSTFEKNYLDPVNAGTKDPGDLKNIGATVTATAVNKIVSEASKLYAALSGKIVENPDAWNQAAFKGKYKVSASSTSIESSSDSSIAKFYSYYDDELAHNEFGRWYIGQEGDFAAAIAISVEGFEGGYILSSKYTDFDYKASPFCSASALPSGDTGAALTSLKDKALALSSASPFDTIEHQAISLYAKGDHAKVDALNKELTSADVPNLGIKVSEDTWPTENRRQTIANRYTVYDKTDNELGVVYEAEFHLAKEESSGDEIEAHGGLYFLLGFSGEDYDNPILTDILVLENHFSKATKLRTNLVEPFNNSNDHSWTAFKEICADGEEVTSDPQRTGATISSQGLFKVADIERKDYASLKGGK